MNVVLLKRPRFPNELVPPLPHSAEGIGVTMLCVGRSRWHGANGIV